MSKKPYITKRGYQDLRAEYDALWNQRRPQVVKALSAAAAEGDRSENAEYQYRKKELREIDRRVRYLQRRLPALEVVSQKPADPGKVFFGARVTLANPARQQRCYRIVGSDETDSAEENISVDSPVARALLGRKVGDCVTVVLPQTEVEYEVLSIVYS